ncbi:hypothetical protein AOL_s00081g4 [Orbilia oligospora ATCC 24927]|uniref:Uncharacterized protein n=1 Tax=Arthrobotrys oligospora (strain ATCC 24927 / CBS 115.81 / DSM 1491) TaxID=756982 RepID=G1XF63_ARTOA|nr:hypothetical protein AOL_s00081g4 [Orbilia oligospora ATCC 24927]EGX48141.1 hypothetical protein AOL_s00081g4 [Orbilia oligospora ATCC 24927]
MRFTIGTAAIALLSCVNSVYGHSLILQAHGNCDPEGKKNGRNLGWSKEVNKHGRHKQGLHPFELDSVVFSDPPLAHCCGKKNPGRVQVDQGCGLTLWEVWARDMWPYPKIRDLGWGDQRVKNIIHSKRRYTLNVTAEMSTLMNEDMISQASGGGWLKMRIHQVNQDGAGPYKCKIDETGMGDKFPGNHKTEWIYLNKVPGGQDIASGPGSKNKASMRKPNLWLTLPIPNTVKCTGIFGKYKNVCMVRCQNEAVNGPFGGCVPFVQTSTDTCKPLTDPPTDPPVNGTTTSGEYATTVTEVRTCYSTPGKPIKPQETPSWTKKPYKKGKPPVVIPPKPDPPKPEEPATPEENPATPEEKPETPEENPETPEENPETTEEKPSVTQEIPEPPESTENPGGKGDEDAESEEDYY